MTPAAGDLSCTKEMVNASYGAATGGRSFFATVDAMTIAAGSHVVIYGYDTDTVIAERRLLTQC